MGGRVEIQLATQTSYMFICILVCQMYLMAESVVPLLVYKPVAFIPGAHLKGTMVTNRPSHVQVVCIGSGSQLEKLFLQQETWRRDIGRLTLGPMGPFSHLTAHPTHKQPNIHKRTISPTLEYESTQASALVSTRQKGITNKMLLFKWTGTGL
ncbi:unnamed protein product [Protopolystoma xenopodis]|uniref:Uncharacterized protein n=1 Tax=Protopolystoma xenopodis TaxID=117903 RepID=A0A3S5CSF5_9PLAT|nr:unnamed protein product [Protopolystoma xenopodis]